ncbi:MAG: type II secretion system F family protein [Planctomycetota bacterium]
MGLQISDLSVLSDELRNVMRAGLPLEASLARISAGSGRRVRRFLQVLGERLQRGEDLAAIVATQRGGVPRMAAAALGAGLQSGRPGLTVEMMGDYAEDVLALRGQVQRAATYPLLVAGMASVLLLLVVRSFLLHYYDIVVLQNFASVNPLLVWLLQWNQQNPRWVVLPLFTVISILLSWKLSGRASAMAFRGPERFLFLLPGIRQQVQSLQSYALARMLALLTAHQLPWDLALKLAGAASGSRSLEKACQQLAERSAAGTAAADAGELRGLPPVLACCLRQTDRREQQLRERLQSVADYYRQQFERGQLLLQLILPTALFVLITVGSVLAFSLLVFWPVVELYLGVS